MPIINTIGNASGRAYGFTRGGASKILISSTPGPAATITTYTGYIVFKFTASATLNVGAGAPGTADVLLVKGGSSGSSGQDVSAPPPRIGGPGGAGGTVKANPAATITANSPIPVVVGGAATDSTFGPLSSTPGSSGGAGGSGAGPGGIYATSGSNGPTNNYLTGSPQYWSGGGGGGGNNTVPEAGSGGSAGGGAGGPGFITPRPFPNGAPYNNPGSAGAANTGGGGGGGATDAFVSGGGGAGGSGIVIVRFPDAQFTTS